MPKRCCADYKAVCSKSAQLTLEANQRANFRERSDLTIPSRRCWRSVLGEAVPELESSHEVSEFVRLASKRSRQKMPSTVQCNCGAEKLGMYQRNSYKREEHEPICNRTLAWIVRVKFETESGGKGIADSVRLCAADAQRLLLEYRGLRASIVRVYPPYR